MYTFTLWPNRYYTEAKLVSLTWNEWVRELSQMEGTSSSKSSLPGLVLGRMIEGERRTNANVKTIEALALDIERGTRWDNVDEYTERLKGALQELAPYEYIAYTTYSHTEEDPRLRIILPLSSPADPKDYKALMGYLNTLTGGVADPGAQKLSQPVYLPRCPEGSSDHWATHHPGKMLDPHDAFVREVIEMRMSLGEGMGRAPHDAATRQACKRVLACRAFAEPGNRDEAATRIAWHLSKRHHNASLELVETVFKWSIEEMGSGAPDAENIHSKLARGSEKRVSELQSSEPAQAPVQGGPYVVQFRSSYYFRLPGGGFSRPFSKDEAKLAAFKHLRCLEGVQLNYLTANGTARRKSIDRLIEEYGDLAQDVLVDLRLPEATFRGGILREATVNWPKDLEPVYDPKIDHWLDMLGGEKLKDWLSILADLNRLSSALVLMGPRSIGKTLLAMGCAKRFGATAPAKQTALTGHFQEELARCPLVYIDEDIEDNPYDRNFLATIRSELSIRERSVNRKYMTPLQMEGAIRCIISANHLPFRQKDSQTGQDLEAIAERFYWINAQDEAAAYLKAQGPDVLNYWREEGIARHIRHLEETRAVSNETRFGVSGDSEKLADLINISVRWNSWVTEWICNGVMDGFARLAVGDQDIKNGAIIYDSAVYVRVKAIVKAWERYLPNNRTAPDTRPISDALRGIAEPGERYQPRDLGIQDGNNQHRYYKIRSSPLLTFLDQTGSGTAAELEEALQRGNARRGT